ncbi:MAG TPA: GNAT family N-acetyltransferase, partial [Candidatus Limnocylindrales bacterium]
MIELRVADTDEDLEAWRQVRMTVLPDERTLSIEEMRAMDDDERTYLIAFLDGRLAGSGLGGRSSFGYAGLHPRVLPEARRRGVGSAILRDLADRAIAQGFTEAGTNIEESGALAFAERFGYAEVDRQVEQVRTLAADEPWPTIPDGITVVSMAERPELWAEAYEALALEAFADMATYRPIMVTREQWERDWLDWPEGMFLALAGDEIVGCAGLERDDDHP